MSRAYLASSELDVGAWPALVVMVAVVAELWLAEGGRGFVLC